MNPLNSHIHARLYVFLALAGASVIALAALFWSGATLAARGEARPGTPGVPYPDMPAIAPIGVSVDKYVDIPDSAKGPPIDPAKGYRTQKLGDSLYMVTDGGYQSMFMTYPAIPDSRVQLVRSAAARLFKQFSFGGAMR